MNILGIDPGQSGGIALIGDHYASAQKMPATERDVYEALQDTTLEGVKPFAYIELAASMPGNSARSMFSFGQNYGMLRMALIALAIPFETVRPLRWQTALGCRTKGDKNVSKAAAQRLFPDIKMTHAIADSLLIAEYGRRIRA